MQGSVGCVCLPWALGRDVGSSQEVSLLLLIYSTVFLGLFRSCCSCQRKPHNLLIANCIGAGVVEYIHITKIAFISAHVNSTGNIFPLNVGRGHLRRC